MKHDLGGFKIICERCNLQDKPSNTKLYINWDRKFYAIGCSNCRASEVFTEDGRRIPLFDDEPEGKPITTMTGASGADAGGAPGRAGGSGEEVRYALVKDE